MRKILLTVLSVILLICAGSAFACSRNNKKGNYHEVIFYKANGVTYVSSINSGKEFRNGSWDIKEGETVTFSVKLADDAVGELEVYCNDDKLRADDGVYSVEVTEDCEIMVDGIDAVGDYNRLVVTPNPGALVTFINVDKDGSTLKNGMMVRSGTEVQFIVAKADDYYGTPKVYANSTELALANGAYSFVMREPTKIRIEGIQKNISLTFAKGDNRVEYIDVNSDGLYFETDKPIASKNGEEIVFDLKISVYYDKSQGYEVQANTTIITPQADGHYHFTLQDDTTISVTNLKQDEAFVSRKDGTGTQSDPYRLSKPIDLYEMAMRINDEFYMGSYSSDYYELVADIDFENEQLFVIGDGSSGYAYFGGHFDGNGHTISNYYITDTRVEQSEFSQLFLTNVGMFGYVMPGANGSPVIKDLTLQNFAITANGSRSAVELTDYSLVVGSLAGATYGASITNVSAKGGRIQVTGGKNRGAYVGGLIGQQFSEYSMGNSSYKFESGVVSCMTNVNINITSDGNSFVFATGGISGALIVGDEHYTSYILNSYSTGNITGGQYAGGIVGYASNHSAIANCYASGNVRAIVSLTGAAEYLDSVYYATAGGIAGYADYSTVISSSFFTGTVSAQSNRNGEQYRRTSRTVAAYADSSSLTNADATLPKFINLPDNVSKADVTKQFIEGLGWSGNDWVISNGLPVLNPDVKKPSITVNFSNNKSITVNPVTLDAYKSLAGWSIDGVIDEFIGSGANRSYGYFFDEGLTEKVPRSFIITSDITLYVGYADYSAISGVYYLGDSVREEATLELTADGNAIYRDGALNQTATYSWDGTNLILYYSAIGALSELEVSPELAAIYFGSYYIYSGTIDGDFISIKGGAIEEIDSYGDYTGNILYMFPDSDPLTGYKKVDGFKYGSYYFAGGEYVFFGNRTGLLIAGNEEKVFTYTFTSDNKLTLTFEDDKTEEATVSGGYVTAINSNLVTALDEFAGKWEKSFESHKEYTFDGKGNWTYNGYDSTSSGSYKIEGGVLKDNANAFIAQFVDGFLVVTKGQDTTTFYKEGSFKGDWYYNGLSNEGTDIAVGITFDGIGTNGYGAAHVEYSTGTAYELTYGCSVENEVIHLFVYYRDLAFGQLIYNNGNITLSGTLNGHYVRFTAYDGLLGKWLSDDDTIEYVEFNGNGFYQLSGEGNAVSVRGTVRVNGKQRVNYSFDRSNNGSFTYDSVNYTFTYDEITGVITVSGNSKTFHLALPDSWYGKELKDEDGKIYTFDGRGNLPDGGKITVTGGTVYTYKLNGENVTLNGGATLTKGEHNGKSVYVLSDSGNTKYLTLNTPFTGDWVLGGLGGTLTIGEIYADNTASGSYAPYDKSQKDISLTYYPDGKYLTFRYDDVLYRVTVSAAGDNYHIDLSFGNSSLRGIPIGLADDLMGKVYFILDENGEPGGGKIVFDGLGVYEFANGAAVVVKADGSVDRSLIYRINYYGDWIVDYAFYRYVFIPCEKDTQFDETVLYRLVDGEGKYFAIVSPDGLYEYKVKDAADRNAYYLFSGHGEVTHVSSTGEETVYYYEIVQLSESFKHLLRFTPKDGGDAFTVILDLSGSQNNWNISKSE